MKDLVISGKRLSFEIKILAACFFISFMINVGAVIAYDRPWVELISQLGFVVVISMCLYVILLLARLLCWGLTCCYKSIFKVH